MPTITTLTSLKSAIMDTVNNVSNILTISNNSVTIDPLSGSYFEINNIDDNLSISISSIPETVDANCFTIYIKLTFEDDNIVVSWPNNISWCEDVPPMVSRFEACILSLITFDKGITYTAQAMNKTKPMVDCTKYFVSSYMEYVQLTQLPSDIMKYMDNVRPTSLEQFFSDEPAGIGSRNITSLDLSNWDVSKCFNLFATFFDCRALNYLNISTWDVSNVKTMKELFKNCNALTSLDLANWQTTNVTDISSIFQSCSSLFALDLSGFDTSKVTLSSNAFNSCNNLQYIVLNSRSVKFTKSDSLRSECKILVPEASVSTYTSHSAWSSKAAQIDAIENYLISKSNGQILSILPNPFETKPLTNLSEWAKNTYPGNYQTFTSLPSDGEDYLNSVKGTNMYKMFANCTNLEELDMSEWNTRAVTSMQEMFSGCSAIEELDFSGLDTSNVTNVSNMFKDCTNLTTLDLSDVDFSSANSCSGMFDNCSSLTNIIFDNLKVNNSLIRLLYRDSRFDSILPDLDTSGVTDLDFQYFLSEMRWRSDYYWGGKEFYPTQYLDLTGWDTSHITKMKYLFKSTIGIGALNISTWNTSNVIDMSGMFYFDAPIRFTDDPPPHFTSLDLSNWNTSKVSDMEQMFYQAWDLNILDISNWDTSGIGQTEVYYDEDFGSVYGDMSEMFMRTPLQYLSIGSPTFKFDMKDSNCGSLNGSCKILVPQALLSTYQNATNWSSRASQFDAIENYTIVRSNGTVTVTPNT